jgi:Fe2+ transport system protein FeoA
MMKLTEMEPNTIARIIKVEVEENYKRRLALQGILEGNFIRIISCSRPIVVETDGKVTAIGLGIAHKIMVIEQR